MQEQHYIPHPDIPVINEKRNKTALPIKTENCGIIIKNTTNKNEYRSKIYR